MGTARRISGRYPTVSTKDVIEFITSCFEADNKESIKKQKHTAKRIYNRLVEEKGFIGGETGFVGWYLR